MEEFATIRRSTSLAVVEQYANNPVEVDHECLKARLRPMRGLKRLRSARVISTGHAFVQLHLPAHGQCNTAIRLTGRRHITEATHSATHSASRNMHRPSRSSS
jgi:transposase-like protein